jgi:hypothetical protein
VEADDEVVDIKNKLLLRQWEQEEREPKIERKTRKKLTALRMGNQTMKPIQRKIRIYRCIGRPGKPFWRCLTALYRVLVFSIIG